MAEARVQIAEGGPVVSLRASDGLMRDDGPPRLVSWQPGPYHEFTVDESGQISSAEAALLKFAWRDDHPGLDGKNFRVEAGNGEAYADVSSSFSWSEGELVYTASGNLVCDAGRLRLSVRQLEDATPTTCEIALRTRAGGNAEPFVSAIEPLFLIAGKAVRVEMSGRHLERVAKLRFESRELEFSAEEDGSAIHIFFAPVQASASPQAITLETLTGELIESPALIFVGEDRDGDGRMDGAEAVRDQNGDGLVTATDLDADGDGQADEGVAEKIRNFDDFDLDGIPDLEDSDIDGDGVANDEDPDPRDSAVGRGGAFALGVSGWLLCTPLPVEAVAMDAGVVGETRLSLVGEAPAETLSVSARAGNLELMARLEKRGEGFVFRINGLPLEAGLNSVILHLARVSAGGGRMDDSAEVHYELDIAPPALSFEFKKSAGRRLSGYKSLYSELKVKGGSGKAPWSLSGSIRDNRSIDLESIEVRLDNFVVDEGRRFFSYTPNKDGVVSFSACPNQLLDIHQFWQSMRARTGTFLELDELLYGPHTLRISARDGVGNTGHVLVSFYFDRGGKMNFAYSRSAPDCEALPGLAGEDFLPEPLPPLLSACNIELEDPAASPEEGLEIWLLDSPRRWSADAYAERKFSILNPQDGSEDFRLLHTGGALEQLYRSSGELAFGKLPFRNPEAGVNSQESEFSSDALLGTETRVEGDKEITVYHYQKTTSRQRFSYATEDPGFLKVLGLADIDTSGSFPERISGSSAGLYSTDLVSLPDEVLPWDESESHPLYELPKDSYGSSGGAGGGSSGGGVFSGGGSGGGTSVGSDASTGTPELLTTTWQTSPGLLTLMVGEVATFSLSPRGPGQTPEVGLPSFGPGLTYLGGGRFQTLRPSFETSASIPEYGNYEILYENRVHLVVDGIELDGNSRDCTAPVSLLYPRVEVDPSQLIMQGGNLELTVLFDDLLLELSNQSIDHAPSLSYNDSPVSRDNYQIESDYGGKVVAKLRITELHAGLNSFVLGVRNALGLENRVTYQLLIGDGDGLKLSRDDRFVESLGAQTHTHLSGEEHPVQIRAQRGRLLEAAYASTGAVPHSVSLKRTNAAEPFADRVWIVPHYAEAGPEAAKIAALPLIVANPGERVELTYKGSKGGMQSLTVLPSGLGLCYAADAPETLRQQLALGETLRLFAVSGDEIDRLDLRMLDELGLTAWSGSCALAEVEALGF
ncbi:MAG: thrombospondin type 3 repeat-containing protein, partial [Planctomycetes bacterium]|nr:thrombospondin type 3 repeat-containing protein [Planctomycetota bacterium]